MSDELIQGTRLDGDVELITLNRPERRNAMVPEMMAALTEALGRFRPSSESASGGSALPHAVVLSGAGSAFCVGADLKWITSQPEPGEALKVLLAGHHATVRALRTVPVPVVAAVNGPAAGGGISLALGVDYRVASENASFTAAYFRIGLVPDGGNTVFFQRFAGAARTLEWLLTNRTVSAREALEWGLVNEVVPADQLLERAREVAASFVSVPPASLLDTRRLLDSAHSQSFDAQLDAEEAAMSAAASRPEFKAALDAFFQR
jgi:2-(1,2-epoxy-1,2-dihydrophenyl)acetyl-CoA isomerase